MTTANACIATALLALVERIFLQVTGWATHTLHNWLWWNYPPPPLKQVNPAVTHTQCVYMMV